MDLIEPPSINDENSERKTTWNPADMQEKMIEYCITGWENVEDNEGNPIEFSKDKIKLLPYSVYVELLNKVTSMTMRLNEEGTQLKNLLNTSDSSISTENIEKTEALDSTTDVVQSAKSGVRKRKGKHSAKRI